MTGPQAIETRYKGYRFRSRIEARWAVFFDALGVKWEYESQGFKLGDVAYLPDFWLPEHEMWVEIKGAVPSGADIGTVERLATASGKPVMLCWGSVGERCAVYGEIHLPAVFSLAGWHDRSEAEFENAIAQSRSARFEHGETPEVARPTPKARRDPGDVAERGLIRALLLFPGRVEMVAERLDASLLQHDGYRAIYEYLLAAGGDMSEFEWRTDSTSAAPLIQELADEHRQVDESDIDDGLAFIRARALDRKMQRIDRMLPTATEAEQTELIREKAELRRELTLLGRNRRRAFRR